VACERVKPTTHY